VKDVLLRGKSEFGSWAFKSYGAWSSAMLEEEIGTFLVASGSACRCGASNKTGCNNNLVH
jgi:hypothetical protein